MANCRPRGEPTGIANPRCYARVMRDCCSELSGEHVVSRAILERFVFEGGVEFTSGSDDERVERMLAPSSAGVANVLCKRHNSALGPLDTVGLRLFMRLEEATRRAAGHDAEVVPPLLTGFDVERFLLKVVAGYLASGSSGPKQEIPESWCRVLWGGERLNGRNGLYVCAGNPEHEVGVRVGRLRAAHGPIVGGTVTLFGMELHLVADGTGGVIELPRGLLHRPSYLLATTAHGEMLTELDFGPRDEWLGVRLDFQFAETREGRGTWMKPVRQAAR